MTMGNHSKHFIVDDIATYIGSQNLYVCDLAEWVSKRLSISTTVGMPASFFHVLSHWFMLSNLPRAL